MPLGACFPYTSAAYTDSVDYWNGVVVLILLVNTGFNKYRYSSGIYTKFRASQTITVGLMDGFWIISTVKKKL